MSNADDLLAALDEGVGTVGVGIVGAWLRRATLGRRARPVLLAGPGSEAIAIGLLLLLVRAGVDALAAPWSWISPRGGLPEHLPPAVVALVSAADDPHLDRLDTLAARTALLVAADDGYTPFLPLASLLLLDLPRDRVGDLDLLASIGWPELARR